VSFERCAHVVLGRWQSGLLAVFVLTAPACSARSELSPEPPTMSVINQINGVDTEIDADSWCTNGLLNESCAAVDGPVTEVVAACDDRFVVALPDTFSPELGDPLGQFPAEGGGAWPVEVQVGTVMVNADGSGNWSKASWTFELTRNDEGC
jgi:hypothetical protein